ncbi:MAG: DUF1836 domain-containing protein [Erysipelotrichaceae bacterium]|nr:DUF1836 domain-containing protein [Erysipelotrichaceae bacterium]
MEKETNERERFTLPRYQDIPDVGLYLDQVVKYINGFFTEDGDLTITPSMLTNYVKLKLVQKVRKKTYSRDQIALFFFVAMAKTVLSIDNVRLCLSVWNEGEEDFSKNYTLFREKMLNALSGGEEESKEDSMIGNITSAIARKLALDRFFRSLEETAQQ